MLRTTNSAAMFSGSAPDELLEVQIPLRAQVARLRSQHRAQHAEMAERTRVARASFVNQIHAEVTQRIMPEVAQLRASFRVEHAEMAERARAARASFCQHIRAWVG